MLFLIKVGIADTSQTQNSLYIFGYYLFFLKVIGRYRGLVQGEMLKHRKEMSDVTKKCHETKHVGSREKDPNTSVVLASL